MEKAIDGIQRIRIILAMFTLIAFTESLSEAVSIEPDAVAAKAKGLVAAGRVGDQASPRAAAEMLAAILCTDSHAATGAADLPFAGAILGGDCRSEIGPNHPAYSSLNASFADMLTALIDAARSGARAPGSVQKIAVIGDGEGLRARIEMDAPGSLEAGALTCWFGYSLLPGLLALVPAKKTALQRSHEVNGAIVDQIASMLGESVERGAA